MNVQQVHGISIPGAISPQQAGTVPLSGTTSPSILDGGLLNSIISVMMVMMMMKMMIGSMGAIGSGGGSGIRY